MQDRPKSDEKMRKGFGSTIVTIAIVFSYPVLISAGSCRKAKLCCQGRDSGCVIQKASPNAIIESPQDKPCYCDHACLRLADCCDDFNDTCVCKFEFIHLFNLSFFS